MKRLPLFVFFLAVSVAGKLGLGAKLHSLGPNVIFIMSDDQGQWTLGCYGNKEIRTPNLDKLAASGVRLTRAFCTTPVCSPSRATFLTGRIPSQHGIHDWIDAENVGPQAKEFLKNEIGYTQILAHHGYVCGFSGKWHCGDSLKKQQGFTSWFVTPTGGGEYNNPPMIDTELCTTSAGQESAMEKRGLWRIRSGPHGAYRALEICPSLPTRSGRTLRSEE